MRVCPRALVGAQRKRPRDDEGKPLAFLNVGTGIDLSISKLAKMVASAVDFNGSIHWDHSKPDGTPKKQLDVAASLPWVGEHAFLYQRIDRRRE